MILTFEHKIWWIELYNLLWNFEWSWWLNIESITQMLHLQAWERFDGKGDLDLWPPKSDHFNLEFKRLLVPKFDGWPDGDQKTQSPWLLLVQSHKNMRLQHNISLQEHTMFFRCKTYEDFQYNTIRLIHATRVGYSDWLSPYKQIPQIHVS